MKFNFRNVQLVSRNHVRSITLLIFPKTLVVHVYSSSKDVGRACVQFVQRCWPCMCTVRSKMLAVHVYSSSKDVGRACVQFVQRCWPCMCTVRPKMLAVHVYSSFKTGFNSSSPGCLNPFAPNTSFLYPLKILRFSDVFRG